MSRLEHSFWLLPAEPLATRLRALIADLARSWDTAPFEPHVTLYCGVSDDAATSSVLKHVTGQFGPVELTFGKLETTSEYTKTLFFQFEENAAAREIFKTILRLSAQPSNYALNPHLSLIYGALPLEAKQKIMRSLELPKGTYLFDRVRAIETEIPLTAADQIRKWRVVSERVLTQRT